MASVEIADGSKIGIVGSGLIGRSWAMLFAGAGFHVSLYDVDADRVKDALDDILVQLTKLSDAGQLRGELTVAEQHALISGVSSLEECLDSAVYVQECTPEGLEQKQKIFAELDKLTGPNTILASSTSTIPSSKFSSDLAHRSQVLVVHPVNPPYYCPLTEVVPSPHTDPAITDKTVEIMRKLGQTPVLQKKEMCGFALNRIQYIIMSECWRLVQDDVISPEDIDKIMTDGLGMRYAFVGVFETMHLNADGFLDLIKKYGPGMNETQASFGPPIDANPESETAQRIGEAMNKKVPLSQLNERRQWRNDCLAALSKLKSQQSK